MKIPIREYWKLLKKYFVPQKGKVTLLTVLLFSNIGLQLVLPQIIRSFIDITQAGVLERDLWNIAGWFIGVAVLQQLVAVGATYLSEDVAWTATNAMRVDLADHCMNLDMTFHKAHTPGELIERLDGDVTTLSNFFSQFVIQLMGSLFLLVGILILLFRENFWVGLSLTIFSLIALFVMARFRNIAVPHWNAERETSAKLFGFLEERLAGTEDIRANGAKDYVMRHFYRLMHELMNKSLKAALMINILINTFRLLLSAAVAVAFWFGAYFFTAEIITIGTVYLIFHYTNMLDHPIQAIARQMEDLQKAGAGITRIRELLGIQSKIRTVPVLDAEAIWPAVSSSKALAVEFQNVVFSYDDRINRISENPPGENGNGQGDILPEEPEVQEIVLQDISFKLQPGSILGLLGRTGSGKTTLVRLLFRLYDTDSGQIKISSDDQDGTDIRSLPLEFLRQQVGMVTQNIQLFHASIRDNLTLFDETVSDAEILQVIDDLGLRGWLDSMPDGLDTELASGGRGLSAGEAQLLAFTRIFLKDPGLVILDEASSRLDPATETLIERAVDRLVKDRTAIIIAHRLETVNRADEIIILEKGSVLEYGNRQQLEQDSSSRFYQLLQTGMEEVLA